MSTTSRNPGFEPLHRRADDTEGPVLCFCFRGRELLVTESGELPGLEVLESASVESVRSQYLGILRRESDAAVHIHSVELEAETTAPGKMRFHDLRALFGRMDETLHALAGRAVQIVEWDRSHQFCGACGKPTEPSESDRSRTCPDCRIPQFPRLSPAIIVSVERGDEILLARSPHFPPGIMSVLAGFVEPGESCEEAVVREVWEETGVRVGDVRYFSSQPWPFPNSLMLGFVATWESGEIEIDGEEIVEARWYKADDMPNFFPGNMSISQWLIGDFLARNARA
jgi:NAD+ diphosphatase